MKVLSEKLKLFLKLVRASLDENWVKGLYELDFP